MESIFNIVYLALMQMALITGLSYREINITVYFFIIPMIYFVMIDKIINRHIFKISFLLCALFILMVFDFYELSDWLFSESIMFLGAFAPIGINYIEASVIFCVVTPSLIFVFLFYYCIFVCKKKKNFSEKNGTQK